MDVAARSGPGAHPAPASAVPASGGSGEVPAARAAAHDEAARDEAPPTSHIVTELGLRLTDGEGALHGHAQVTPHLCVPGTSTLRTSVLATWADVIAGTVVGEALSPRIPLTLDLEIQLYAQARSGARIGVAARLLKVGRTVVVSETRFHDEASGAPLAVALISFIASPNPRDVFPEGFPRAWGNPPLLAQPLADRVGGRIVVPGTFEMARRPDGLNATGAIQGGLVSFAAEEAASSLVAGPVVVEAMNVRYFRPISTGPARAVAEGDGRFSVVRITDVGVGKLSTVATVRLTDPA
ncbi:hotdog domain-containing protein [Pseudofrankia inefficax]|uniref:Thioesterase superfamily protein n=1 Tax=Pseudofrankia inefficax (strain DSM 45817 / CECT 9037 / DDB 130130 / EuI1c) TaxID=298654 RepID=E3J5E1_PSEI1|nr:hotdog domain-containing protein [Pseudofrankia inefficax]ADP81885.1 thioesterase superfamily protein [Pseudofrankia inefficax]